MTCRLDPVVAPAGAQGGHRPEPRAPQSPTSLSEKVQDCFIVFTSRSKPASVHPHPNPQQIHALSCIHQPSLRRVPRGPVSRRSREEGQALRARESAGEACDSAVSAWGPGSLGSPTPSCPTATRRPRPPRPSRASVRARYLYSHLGLQLPVSN